MIDYRLIALIKGGVVATANTFLFSVTVNIGKSPIL